MVARLSPASRAYTERPQTAPIPPTPTAPYSPPRGGGLLGGQRIRRAGLRFPERTTELRRHCLRARSSIGGRRLGSGALTGAQSLASAGNDTSFCALLTSGGVDCWGDDSLASLATGPPPAQAWEYPSPVQVLGVGGRDVPLSGVTSLVGGNSDYCAVLNDGGNVVCWGYGAGGQRGDGTDTYNVDYPVQVDAAVGTPLTGAVGLANDGVLGSYCAVRPAGRSTAGGVTHKATWGMAPMVRMTAAVTVAPSSQSRWSVSAT